MDENLPPVPRRVLDEKLEEIQRGEYITLEELEARILRGKYKSKGKSRGKQRKR